MQDTPKTKTFLRQYQILGRPEVTPEQAAANAAARKWPRTARPAIEPRIPVSPTTWFNWQKSGRAPLPVRLPGTRAALYRAEDIDALIAKLGGAQ